MTDVAMIDVEEAFAHVRREVRQVEAEQVELNTAIVGRVLAEDVYADTDLPPFNRAQMDGFALRAEDTAHAPVNLKTVGEAAAGRAWRNTLEAHQAVRIMTGAPIPKGADAVQQVELTSSVNDEVSINQACVVGQNIVAQAAEVSKGALTIKRGTRLNPHALATLASFGCAQVLVARRPRVAVLATGAELVAVNQTPLADQIRDSNSLTLAAYAEEAGAEVKRLPLVADEPAAIKQAIVEAATHAEMIVLSGGVSVGDYDFTKPVLRNLGAQFFFERVRLRPGKPTVFARLNETLIFGLPGNPVSVAVTFELFARYALLLMQGATHAALREDTAILGRNLKSASARASYLPARLETDENGRLIAQPLKWGGSSDFVSFADAEALIIVPADKGILEAATIVRIVHLPR